METIDPRGVAKCDSRVTMAQFMKRTMSHCQIPNIKVVGFVVSEKKSFDFFPIKMLMLPWQPEFQTDPPKNNMQLFLLPCGAVCII